MVALLRGMLPPPHRDVFLFGATVFAPSTAVWTWTWAGLALHAGALDPAITRTVLDIALVFGPVLTGATTTMMAPVTLLALRGNILPRWLGVLGLVAFVEQSIEAITIFGGAPCWRLPTPQIRRHRSRRNSPWLGTLGHSSGTVRGRKDTFDAQKCPSRLARPEGIEPPTCRFEAWRPHSLSPSHTISAPSRRGF
jgi:hypothetical protein